MTHWKSINIETGYSSSSTIPFPQSFLSSGYKSRFTQKFRKIKFGNWNRPRSENLPRNGRGRDFEGSLNFMILNFIILKYQNARGHCFIHYGWDQNQVFVQKSCFEKLALFDESSAENGERSKAADVTESSRWCSIATDVFSESGRFLCMWTLVVESE